jgi:hypothetical protein
MIKRTVWQANVWIRERAQNGPRTAEGICKISVEAAYNVPSDGTGDASAGWADTITRIPDAFTARKIGHRWYPGALDWWTGGTHGDGHVTVRAYKRGYVWTKDLIRPGMWDRVPVENVAATWTLLHYAGASRDISRIIVRP